MSVSVLILARNEQLNINGCLESVKWCNDIVVYDSYSTDQTAIIARAFGARVLQRAFDNYGAQREAARREVPYKYPWVLALDADERVEPALADEVQQVAAESSQHHAAYRVRRKDHFMGRWIRHATLYPSWFVRLYRPDRIYYDGRTVHEYPVVNGTVGELRHHLIHHSFNKGLADWWAKHARYASLEAGESFRVCETGRIDWPGLFCRADPVRRRRALKALAVRLPCRPTLRFLYTYLLRGGFLDGRAGLAYCRLLAMYEYLIVLNQQEILRRRCGLPI
jgi:glycosyltransferase involved in cell wall biosynthesis